MATRSPGQVAIRRWLLSVVLAAVAAGCAQPGNQALGASQAGGAPPATVTIGPADDGKTVDLQVSDRLAVELKAASTNGRVEVDGALPLKSEKGGRRVEAELGGGGAPLSVKVVNGNIRIKQ